jgi:hypothetical protein
MSDEACYTLIYSSLLNGTFSPEFLPQLTEDYHSSVCSGLFLQEMLLKARSGEAST